MDVFSRISKAIGGQAPKPPTSNGASKSPEKGQSTPRRTTRKVEPGGDAGVAAAFKDNWRAIQVR